MPVILSRRDAAARELMDRPDCDPDMLATTYRNFAKVNRLFAAWRRVYLRLLRPLLRPGVPATLLDIGCGGGDVVRTLDRWATADGLCLRVTGIDPDPRAAAFLAAGPVQANVRYFAATAAELATRGERYDFVISNNVLHHLPPGRLAAFCRHSRVLCRQRVIHNDIRRGDLAYVLFGLLTGPFFRGSFITRDGLTSIRRSYTPAELRQFAPAGWRVESVFPYRNLLVYEAAGGGGGLDGADEPAPASGP